MTIAIKLEQKFVTILQKDRYDSSEITHLCYSHNKNDSIWVWNNILVSKNDRISIFEWTLISFIWLWFH